LRQFGCWRRKTRTGEAHLFLVRVALVSLLLRLGLVDEEFLGGRRRFEVGVEGGDFGADGESGSAVLSDATLLHNGGKTYKGEQSAWEEVSKQEERNALPGLGFFENGVSVERPRPARGVEAEDLAFEVEVEAPSFSYDRVRMSV